MDSSDSKIQFIQPLPFTLARLKKLVIKYKRQLKSPDNSFKFKEEILNYYQTPFDFDRHTFTAHMFFNEKLQVELKHHFMMQLFELEEKLKLKNRQFESLKKSLRFRENNIPKKLIKYFKWNRKTLYIEKNMKAIKAVVSKMGHFVLLTNTVDMKKTEILKCYRKRDCVEKVFDIAKNEMDGDRLRSHSQYSADGRLFLKFIALIIYMEITKVMRDNKLFKNYSIKQLLAELKKLKVINIEKNDLFLSELSKKQKNIFKAFGINENELKHSY